MNPRGWGEKRIRSSPRWRGRAGATARTVSPRPCGRSCAGRNCHDLPRSDPRTPCSGQRPAFRHDVRYRLRALVPAGFRHDAERTSHVAALLNRHERVYLPLLACFRARSLIVFWERFSPMSTMVSPIAFLDCARREGCRGSRNLMVLCADNQIGVGQLLEERGPRFCAMHPRIPRTNSGCRRLRCCR